MTRPGVVAGIGADAVRQGIGLVSVAAVVERAGLHVTDHLRTVFLQEHCGKRSRVPLPRLPGAGLAGMNRNLFRAEAAQVNDTCVVLAANGYFRGECLHWLPAFAYNYDVPAPTHARSNVKRPVRSD